MCYVDSSHLAVKLHFFPRSHTILLRTPHLYISLHSTTHGLGIGESPAPPRAIRAPALPWLYPVTRMVMPTTKAKYTLP